MNRSTAASRLVDDFRDWDLQTGMVKMCTEGGQALVAIFERR